MRCTLKCLVYTHFFVNDHQALNNRKTSGFCMEVGSISSRFVRPRSFAHTTAGSLVCPIVFSTNQRLACTKRAGKYLIGQFSLVNNKDGGYLCGKIFCCLLNQFLSCSRLGNLGNTSKSTR